MSILFLLLLVSHAILNFISFNFNFGQDHVHSYDHVVVYLINYRDQRQGIVLFVKLMVLICLNYNIIVRATTT